MLKLEGSPNSPNLIAAVILDTTGDREIVLELANASNDLCIDQDSGQIAEKLFNDPPFGMAYHQTSIKPQ